MKVLFWYVEEFSWRPARKTLDDAEDGAPGAVDKAVVAFVHVEPRDVERAKKVETKLVKNLKWLAGKWDTRRLVLHSFAHLDADKADPAFAVRLFAAARGRLEGVGYEVYETPWGHFLDLSMQAPGHPLARVFKDF